MWRRGPKVNTNIQLYFRSQSSGISSFHAGWSDGRCLHQVDHSPVLGREKCCGCEPHVFFGCMSLTERPMLVISDDENMFARCTSLPEN